MKKLLSVLMCLCMLISSALSVAALTRNEDSPNIVVGDAAIALGDADGNGEINAQDAFAIKLNNANAGEVEIDGSDIINDGKINAKDLLALKRHLAGKEDLSAFASDNIVGLFTIGGNSISEYSIVYDADAKYVENMFYSADSLRKYIFLATGTNLSIVTEAETEHVIHFVDVTTIDGLEEELEIENYKWEVVDGDLNIYGTRRGNMYAVYEILEEYLGYRFYSDSFVYQTPDRTVDISEGTSAEKHPALNYRLCLQSFGTSGATTHFFPRKLNATELYAFYDEAFGTLTGAHFGSAHSYGTYWQMATGRVDVNYEVPSDGAAYQAKMNAGVEQSMSSWNPCFTSDADYEILFRGLLECMRMMLAWGHEYRKDTSAFSFSINDNRKVCACSECQYILDDGFFGRDENKKERLNAGETGLNLYLANRAARDIVKYYPGRACSEEAIGEDDDGNIIGYGEPIFDEYPDMKIFTITYAHDMPNEKMLTDERYKDIIPEENLILMWCSQPCNNHFIGSHECGDQANTLGVYQKDATAGLTAWGEVVKASGAEMWYWYYPINYNTKICDTPNIFNIYYDFVYLVEEANITGICHEGMHGVQTVYVFENLKAHLSAMLMWSFEYDENGNLSYMSFDEFCDTIKEYLSIFYGDGYEEIFKYIEMQNEAGDENKVCFVNNCDYPGDMYSYDYIRDNYEEMRELLLVALEKAETDAQKQNVMYLIVGCDVLGLSACHKSWYLEGSDEQKELYTKLYTEMLDYMKENNIDPGVNCNIQEVELDLSKTPLVAFYRGGTWREALNDQWVKLPGYPSWGYA